MARRASFGSFVGAVVEWYDFLLYGVLAALVFNRQFFPSVSPAVGTIASFGTLAVGFVFRPLGGAFFGHFGDRIGPKRILVWTIGVMGLSTVGIGLLPNFSSIGIWAPVLLVLLRAVQGFAVGGEWGGATLMAVSQAPKGRKAFFSSGVQMGYGAGLILANGTVLLVTLVMGADGLASWGWRIPFWLSAPLVLTGLWVRGGVADIHHAAVEKSEEPEVTRPPLLEALTRRVGRKPVYLTGAVLGGVFAFPFFWALTGRHVVWTWVFALVLVNISHDLAVSVQQPLITELFGPQYRYSGAGLGYQVAAVVCGGFTPFIAASLVEVTGSWVGVAWYLVFGCLVSFLTVALMKGRTGPA
ncbi:MAG: MFS transporter [Actinomycetia bacterium]|nr:MFS transporter [Actinomycetes bacterium]